MNNDYSIRGISEAGGCSTMAQILRLMDILQQSHNQSLGIDGRNALNQAMMSPEATRYPGMQKERSINR